MASPTQTTSTETAIKAHQALTRLMEMDNEKSYPIKFSARIKLANNLNLSKPVFDLYVKEHEKLVRELGETKGDQIKVKDENRPDFDKRNADLLASDSGIKFVTIPEAEFAESSVPIGILGDLISVGILVK